jgi:hypothetical protein
VEITSIANYLICRRRRQAISIWPSYYLPRNNRVNIQNWGINRRNLFHGNQINHQKFHCHLAEIFLTPCRFSFSCRTFSQGAFPHIEFPRNCFKIIRERLFKLARQDPSCDRSSKRGCCWFEQVRLSEIGEDVQPG